MKAKNIQEFVVEQVIEYSFKRQKENDHQLHQLQKKQFQIDYLADKLITQSGAKLIKCQYCNAYLYDANGFLEEYTAHIPYLGKYTQYRF